MLVLEVEQVTRTDIFTALALDSGSTDILGN